MYLKKLQITFAEAISKPLSAKCADERLAIYQRLYWFRFFNVFQTCYPFLARLFGYEEFHAKIVEPYILKYPPKTWAINRIGDLLPKWIEEEYIEKDKQLVLWAAKIDLAYELSYYASELASIKEPSENICLQPYIHLFKMPANFFSLRDKFLKESIEYWTDNLFPKITYDKTYYFVLYRSDEGILYEEINEKQYAILSNLMAWDIHREIQKSVNSNVGASALQQVIPAAKQVMCKHMADAAGCKDGDIDAASSWFLNCDVYIEDPKIPEWFCNWTCRGWICDSKKTGKC